jgi:succinate dehydrogenase/fumarate reductase cytochrome b subunit
MLTFSDIPPRFQLLERGVQLYITYQSSKQYVEIYLLTSLLLGYGLIRLTQGISISFLLKFQLDLSRALSLLLLLILLLMHLAGAIFCLIWAVWCIFGITEYRASGDRLLIRQKIFSFDRETHVLSHSIRYFEQTQTEDGMSPTLWNLNIMTNKEILAIERDRFMWKSKWMRKAMIERRKDLQRILLISDCQIENSHWLGRILADFYNVKFRQV